MLFDQNVLQALQKQLGNKYRGFDIHIFLQMLKMATRPLGYPNYRVRVDEHYYPQLIRLKIANAQVSRHGECLHALINSVHHIMICFSYYQDTLNLLGIDDQLISLLFKAVEARADSTNEEKCAEKSMLALIILKPEEALKLFSEFAGQSPCENIQQLLREQITSFSHGYLKRMIMGLPDGLSLELANQKLSNILCVFRKVDKSLRWLHPYAVMPMEKCKAVIGCFLLMLFKNNLNQPWIINSKLIQASIASAQMEQGKEEVRGYIQIRSAEGDPFVFFEKFSKNTKLSAAKKFYSVLNKEREVTFFPHELDALKHDVSSRLTNIYERYKTLVSL